MENPSEKRIRWFSRLMTWAAYAAILLFAVTAITGVYMPNSEAILTLVLLLFSVGPMLLLAAMGLGLYAVLRVNCHECGDRFYSVITPMMPFTWPLKNHCVSCGAEVDVV